MPHYVDVLPKYEKPSYNLLKSSDMSGGAMVLALLVSATSVVGVSAQSLPGKVAHPSEKRRATLVLSDFNGTTLPRNRAGETYPSQYSGSGNATLSLNSSDSITGNSLQFNITSGGFLSQFNPYGPDQFRGFARAYTANPSGWQFNTYNRLSFWIKRPTSASPISTRGQANVDVGTYVKRIANADPHSDEEGGGHYYHGLNLPNNGHWTRIILNMHPSHRRSDSGGVETGIVSHPTGELHYNYFDALTRFYIDDTSNPTPGTYLIDDIQFYRETAPENDAQVYSLTGTYDPGKNEIIVTWQRLKDENEIKHEVRYSFTDIHQIGWEAATRAQKGIIKPPGWQGYNGMVYATQALPLARHPVVYIAIKPQNSKLFSQIAVPLGEKKSAVGP